MVFRGAHRLVIGSWMSICCLALSGCNEAARSAPKPLAVVRLAEARMISIGNGVKYSATIVPYSQVDLAFKSPGYIESILQVRGADGMTRTLDEGDFVAKGTVLAIVQKQDYIDKLAQAKAQADRAQADYERAKLSFDRTNVLYQNQSATKPDFDTTNAQLQAATAGVNAAKASVSEAEVALSYCSLKAPFDGWIVKRSVDVGSLVGPATNGFTIADLRMVRAVFGVPDTAIQRLAVGQRQTITTDSSAEQFTGKITSISPAADPKSRVYSVDVMISNLHNTLKSGMIASISLGGKELQHPAIAIPLSSVIRDTEQPNAFAVLVAQGTADSVTVHSRKVELGDAYGNLIAITSGIQPGERVVAIGSTVVHSGDKVRVIP